MRMPLHRDPAATYHKLEGTPARVVAVVRALLFLWFLWCVRRSFHQERQAASCALQVLRYKLPATRYKLSATQIGRAHV
mgnify:CR=1 FL=1